jgi:hypothetical protein
MVGQIFNQKPKEARIWAQGTNLMKLTAESYIKVCPCHEKIIC